MKCLTVAVACAAVFADGALARNFLTGLLSASSGTITRTLQLLQSDAAAEFCGEDGEPPCPETGCSEDFEESDEGLCVFAGTNAGRAMLQTLISVNGETLDGEGDGSATITVNGQSVTAPLATPSPAPGTYGGSPPIVDPPTTPPTVTPPPPTPTVFPPPPPPATAGACTETGLSDFSFCVLPGVPGVKGCINDCVRVNNFLAICLPPGQSFQSFFADNTVVSCT